MNFIKKKITTLLRSRGIGIYKLKKNKEFEELIKIHNKFKGYEQYKEANFEFEKFSLLVSNVDSALQMYEDIFIDESCSVHFNNPQPLIYDLGANIGLATIYYKLQYPSAKIKAYEANPRVFHYLEENIIGNNFEDVEIHNQAISNTSDFISFNCDKGGQVSSIYKPDKFQTEEVKIPSIRLSDLIKNEDRRIDLIKMDIEGMETDVLIDCNSVLKNVDRLAIEYHSFKESQQELSKIFEILENNGFRYMIKPNSFSNFDLSNLKLNSSHFDTIIHIEAIAESMLKNLN